jgi:hypothetical protein
LLSPEAFCDYVTEDLKENKNLPSVTHEIHEIGSQANKS